VMQRSTVPPAKTNQRNILIAAVVIVLVFVLFRTFGPHENKFEKMAGDVTQAIQKNDSAALAKDFDATAREQMTRQRVGAASDALAPLGKLKSVKEDTPAGTADRVHMFVLTFDHGTAREQFKYDLDGKAEGFNYNQVVINK